MRKTLPAVGAAATLLLLILAGTPTPSEPHGSLATAQTASQAAPPATHVVPPPPWLGPADGVHPPGPDELDIRWIGVAGFELRTAKGSLLFDPYFSRTPLWDLISKPALPNIDRIHRGLRPVDAVFVSHAHFDHFMDAPEVCRELTKPLYCSDQGDAIAIAAGLDPALVHKVEHGSRVQVGDMEIEVVAGQHSDMITQRLAGGDNPPGPAHWPMGFLQFHNGPTFGFAIHWRGRTIYHNASAQIVDSAIGKRHVDVALMCMTGWTATPRLWEREEAALDPRVMIPMHDDDFFQPIERGFVENPLAKRQQGLAGIRKAMPNASLVTLDFLQTVRVHAATGGGH